MIISQTPLRISFAGGGTDLPAFYRRERGCVVSAAIDKYIYIAVNRKFDNRVRASYSVTEIVDIPSELKHELIREAIRMVGLEGGLEITSISDVPSHGTGLGSSSAYTVGLLNALYAYSGRMASPAQLAEEASRIEIDICGKPIGKQDQYIAAFGGLRRFQFFPDDSVAVDPIVLSHQSRDALAGSLLMLYTGMSRSAGDILAEQRDRTDECAVTFGMLAQMRDLADGLYDRLSSGDVSSFACTMHDGWMLKRRVATTITNDTIDGWCERALELGATGGKLLGAGGGGFILLTAPPDRHAEICAGLPELRPMPIGLEPQGSRIVFVS